MKPVLVYLGIGLGSALGGVARYACGLAAVALGLTGFPWGTLLVNVLGCFVIGLFATLTAPDGRLLVGTQGRQFVMVGICGGYTTFSSFSLEWLDLLRHGAALAAGAYALASLLGCVLLAWVGHALAARLNR